jgi:hypothetical protein
MAENLNLNVNVDTSGATSSVGSLKKQLREAQQEVMALADKFGATSKQAVEAAKKAGELKDRIGDAKALTDAFNPDAKFKALTASLSGVAGGFGAVQGAMALFGAESDNVQKTLLKVQSAMAISQGLQAVGESIDSFRQLGAVIQNNTLFQKANNAAIAAAGVVQKLFTGAVDMTSTSFKFLKGAIAATGIGLLLVAIGTLVAYWDDIKAAVSGVTSEQTRLNEQAKLNLKAEEDKLEAIDSQTNQLKLQGKSEREILNIKIKQSDEAIKAAEITLQNAKITKDLQLQASKRNYDILKGILDFIATPSKLLWQLLDAINKALGKTTNLAAQMQASNDSLVTQLFDPKEVESEGNATIKEAEKTLNGLKEKRAGYILSVQGLDKAAGKEGAQSQAEIDKKLQEANAILHEANKKLKTQQQQEIQTIEEAYAEKRKKLAEAGIKDNGDLAKAEQAEKDVINEKFKKQDLAKEELFQKELNKIKLESKLIGIKNEYEKAKEQLEANYLLQYQDIEKNETYNAEQKIALKAALQLKENAELDALKLIADKKKAEEDITDLDKEIAKNVGKFDIQKELLDKKDLLLKESFDKGLILETAYNAGVEANSKARVDIDKAEAQAKIENAQKISALLGGLSDVMGKETAAGKAFAVASATIDTYLAAQKAYQAMAGIPVVGPALGAVAAGVAIAGGIKNVKAIMAVKTPTGGGGSAPSLPNVSTSAPMTPAAPQAQTTNISQQSINQMGNQAVRAYVIETDVTSNQQRVEAIKQRARFS